MKHSFPHWTGSSRNHVSLGTVALALVLSPAFLQTQFTCERGDTYLLTLEFEVSGQDQIVGFNLNDRSYDVSTTSPTAILRTTSRDPGSTVTYQWMAGSTTIESGMIGVGGGEVTINVPVGQPTLRVSVRSPEPELTLGFYIVQVTGRFDGLPCTEQGIRDAIASGGGPYTFDCAGPTVVTTQATIIIYNDAVLDGEGNLTVDGNDSHGVFGVSSGVTAELRGFTVTGGYVAGDGGGIANSGTLTLTNSTVSGNTAFFFEDGDLFPGRGGGIANSGTLTLINSTVSGNAAVSKGSGIYNAETFWSSGTLTLTNSTVSENAGDGIWSQGGTLTLTNSTVSGNANDGISNLGTLTLTNTTVSGNAGDGVYNGGFATFEVMNSLIEGGCYRGVGSSLSLHRGGNIESPGNTCGLSDPSDQVNVTPGQLNLGPLQDNGGPTLTHAPLPGSFAIDVIAVEDCVDADRMPLLTDQRGVTRPQGLACDVGAVEVEP